VFIVEDRKMTQSKSTFLMPLALHEQKFEDFFTLYMLLTNYSDLFSAACGQQKKWVVKRVHLKYF